MRLLVIEDEDRLSAILKSKLAESGFTVDIAGSPEGPDSALELINYDAAVLDLGLPDGDGLAVLTAAPADPPLQKPSSHLQKPSSQWTLRWREMDSNLYGAFPVKEFVFGFVSSLFGAKSRSSSRRLPSGFAERAGGVKGPKR